MGVVATKFSCPKICCSLPLVVQRLFLLPSARWASTPLPVRILDVVSFISITFTIWLPAPVIFSRCLSWTL